MASARPRGSWAPKSALFALDQGHYSCSGSRSLFEVVKFPMRAEAGILLALLIIALTASLPVGVLYWLNRPMAFPNPGISAYEAPKSDTLVPRAATGVHESYALSISAAKQKEPSHAKRSRFAASARRAGSASISVAMVQRKRQLSERKQRPQSPIPAIHGFQDHSWAYRDQQFGIWYR